MAAKKAGQEEGKEQGQKKQIAKLISSGKPVYGSRRTVKLMKSRQLTDIIYSDNCPELLLKDLNYYAKLSTVRLTPFAGDSSGLGEMCGKPFNVLVVGIRK